MIPVFCFLGFLLMENLRFSLMSGLIYSKVKHLSVHQWHRPHPPVLTQTLSIPGPGVVMHMQFLLVLLQNSDGVLG